VQLPESTRLSSHDELQPPACRCPTCALGPSNLYMRGPITGGLQRLIAEGPQREYQSPADAINIDHLRTGSNSPNGGSSTVTHFYSGYSSVILATSHSLNNCRENNPCLQSIQALLHTQPQTSTTLVRDEVQLRKNIHPERTRQHWLDLALSW
jgi:hypothetical protein